MATYNPKLSLSAAPGVTGYLLLVLYEATAPSVPVATSAQIAPPHTSSVQVQFTGLNPVNHIAKLFETDGSSSTGTILANFSLDPQFPVVELRADLFIYAGITTGFPEGGKSYTAAADYLDGWDYSLEIRGVGTLNPDLDYTQSGVNNPSITDNTTFNPGVYQVQAGEVWVFHFQPKVITYAASAASPPFNTTEEITADRTLTLADLSKAFIIASATSTIEITLPLLSAINANRPMYFMSEGGNHLNAVFVCQGTDKIKYLGEDLSSIVIGQSEELIIYNYSGFFRVLNCGEGVKSVGQIVHSYETAPINTVYANGAELDRDMYPRLWDYVSTKLDASMLVSEATWNTATGGVYTHRAKYSTGNGSTTFRVPLLYTQGFLKGVNSSVRKAGAYEQAQLLDHTHQYTRGRLFNTDSGGDSNYVGSDAVPTTGASVTTQSVGTENRPENTGIYLSIRI